jgi:SNF2 family DNA or RNA helicase
MNRIEAVKYARERLDAHNLTDWTIRINNNPSPHYYGLCSYRDKCIILNGHYLDQVGEIEGKNTVNHEVAHALTKGHGHDEIWAAKARELGCTHISTCSSHALRDDIIDAIRSGADVEVITETETITKHKYQVTRLQDKCPTCGKVAIFDREIIIEEKDPLKPNRKLIFYKCNHVEVKLLKKGTPFETAVSNFWKEHVKNCKHDWNGNHCLNCNEYRGFPFQVEGARFIEAGLAVNKGAAIFDEMGLGKTVQVLMYLLFAPPEAFPILFVVKSGIKFQWFKEILRWLGPTYLPQVIEKSDDWVIPNLKCYIISYDLMVPKIKKLKKKTIEIGFDIEKLSFIKTVVGDEVQQIKNPDSSRTQRFRILCKDKQVIALSGTPWKNRGDEFFPILNILSPDKFHSHANFVRQWVDVIYDGKYTRHAGIRHPKKFQEYIKDIALRREVADVAIQMPSVNRQFHFTNLDDREQMMYDESESDFVKWYNQHVIDGTEDQAFNDMNILAQMARMRHITGLAKIPSTMEKLEEFYEETERKMVVFVHHIDVGDIIYRQMKEKFTDIAVFNLHAGLNSLQREQMATEFNASKRAFMVASTGAAGEGINLQTCGDAIMHERQWNPQNEDQAAPGRFRRIAATHSIVNVTFATAADTIDETLADIVERKRAWFHSSMNKGEMQVFSLSLAKELAMSIVKRVAEKEKGKLTKAASLKK